MVTANSADITSDVRRFFDTVFNGEPVNVPGTNGDAVIISKSDYEEYAKMKRNAAYLAKIDRGIEQMKSGKLQYHELVEVD